MANKLASRRWAIPVLLSIPAAAGALWLANSRPQSAVAGPPAAKYAVPLSSFPRSTVPANGRKIHFKKTVLDTKFRSEGVAVGDFNHDGKLDIAAGPVYYTAPDWKMHSMEEKVSEYDPHNYSHAFLCWADDLNGDGWTDLIVVGFPGEAVYWYENPKGAPGPWPKHFIAPVANNESPAYVDVDGNGHRSLLMGVAESSKNPNGPERCMAILRPDPADPTKPWKIQRISKPGGPGADQFWHGLGIGSIRGNGRNDIVIHTGWFESPAESNADEPWKFHPADFGPNCAQMYVFDINGDGRNDVLSSSAHEYGIWWHEQTADGWKTHEIDHSFSQTHSLVVADIAGDGLPGFVTGKRWWAHGPALPPHGDPGSNEPSVLYWYELQRKDSHADFIRHEIDDHSGVGTQFQVIDVNGDGLLDIVVSNKHGVFLFEQERD